mmetsp:Transcript_27437/g.55338  ORF Transcript_27437/g.55338 Transcript_27437/m.55338 type:complete len:235 (-) Transcript_27437:189-893(-)
MLTFPIWIKLAAVISSLSAIANSAKPFLARELLLKYSIRLNEYDQRTDLPSQCPSYNDLLQVDKSNTLDEVDYHRYQGVWYNFATNDPTQPKGMCRCDRFNWIYKEEDSSFTSLLDIKCQSLGVFRMKLEGKTNVTGTPGFITEGSPSFGADSIPGYILWVSDNYDAAIRYFCAEQYLGTPVFSSLQIWTREPTKRNSNRGMALLRKAHELVSFDDRYLDFAQHTGCNELPRIS